MLIQDDDGRIQETGSGHGLGPGAYNTSSTATETEVRLKLGGRLPVECRRRRACPSAALLQLARRALSAATTGGWRPWLGLGTLV